MKETEAEYYHMFKMVSWVMHLNETIWSGNQIIVDCVKQLDDTIKDIEDASMKLTTTTKTITIGKKDKRKTITENAFQIKDNMRLYYRSINNIEEMQLLTYPISKLNLMTDSDFYQEATIISDKSLLLVTQLLPYGITLAIINKLKDDLLKIKTYKPERDLLSQTNTNLIKLLPVKVEECRLMLRNILGTLVHNYKTTNSGFIIAYDNSRILHKRPGARKHYTVVLKGKTTQTNKTTALSEVTVIAGKQKKTTTTDIDGNFNIKIYTKDADYITFIHPDFETEIIAIKLINPEKHKKAVYTFNVVMVKKNQSQEIKSKD